MPTIKGTIVVTGAAGFIGSCLVGYLNEQGYEDICIADDFSRADKAANIEGKKYAHKVHRDELFAWLDAPGREVGFLFHLGARTDTTEFDYEVHRVLNYDYSCKIWEYCTREEVPLVYASSAATYGAGELGYDDDPALIPRLNPLNPYGVSKNEFDKWALQRTSEGSNPPFWVGLKFFNVYGPWEYHKGRMASVVWHSFNQIKDAGEVKLFRSHRPDFRDGEQLRDFIYVKDILNVCHWLMDNRPPSGIYNLGTGRARTFADLVKATFSALGKPPEIRYIDMPEDIRDKYQYYTEANMSRLREAGYSEPFYSLEEGIRDYVQQYLVRLSS